MLEKYCGMLFRDVKGYSRLWYKRSIIMLKCLQVPEKYGSYVLEQQNKRAEYLVNLDNKIVFYKYSIDKIK